MSVQVPVFLVDRSGDRLADNVNCSPCIDVVVVGKGLAVKAVAMLDSGAAGIAADDQLIDRLQLPPVSVVDFLSAVGWSTATTHDAIIWIDGLPDLSVNMQRLSFRASGHPYDIILGRSFLTMFDFGFDQRTKAWKLALLGAERATNQDRPIPSDY